MWIVQIIGKREQRRYKMSLEEFIKENSVGMTKNLVDEFMIAQAEEQLGISFGAQLKEYILKYGYLSYEYAELYGMNSNEGLKSDLVEQTKYLHKYYPATEHYIAIENRGEGDYFLVDQSDKVFEYDTDQEKLVSLDCQLFDYIVERFKSIQK